MRVNPVTIATDPVRPGRAPQIIVFGGCGVGDRRADPRIFRYVMDATGRERPRILLLTTAAGDSDEVTERLHYAYGRLGASTRHWRPKRDDASGNCVPVLPPCDMVHIEGGNGAFLLHHIRRSGLGPVLRDAWARGVVMTGTSAGASCWFAQAMGASLFPFLDDADPLEAHWGMGILPQSLCVHFDRSPERRQSYCEAIASGIESGFGLDHDAGLHFLGTDLFRVITRRPGATAWSASVKDGGVIVTPKDAIPLASLSYRDRFRCGFGDLNRGIRRATASLIARRGPASSNRPADCDAR